MRGGDSSSGPHSIFTSPIHRCPSVNHPSVLRQRPLKKTLVTARIHPPASPPIVAPIWSQRDAALRRHRRCSRFSSLVRSRHASDDQQRCSARRHPKTKPRDAGWEKAPAVHCSFGRATNPWNSACLVKRREVLRSETAGTPGDMSSRASVGP